MKKWLLVVLAAVFCGLGIRADGPAGARGVWPPSMWNLDGARQISWPACLLLGILPAFLILLLVGRKLAADPGFRERMGDAARVRVLLEFSLDRQVDQFLSLYREVVARDQGPVPAALRSAASTGI